MTKTVNTNYTSISAPGSTFNRRISADSDTFARNDIDALGEALDDHVHDGAGKGLYPVLTSVNVAPGGSQGCVNGSDTAVGTTASITGNGTIQYIVLAHCTVLENTASANLTTFKVLDNGSNVVCQGKVTVPASGYATCALTGTWTPASSGTWTITVNPANVANPSVTAQGNMIRLTVLRYL